MKSREWSADDPGETTLVAFTDASKAGMGVWFPGEYAGFQSRLPSDAPKDMIFFFEALAVCSAIHLAHCFKKTTWMAIYTDNTNTFHIFNTFRALPAYNHILISAINILIEDEIDLRVYFIPSEDNIITDPISHYKNHIALRLAPRLIINSFIPSRNALGVTKK